MLKKIRDLLFKKKEEVYQSEIKRLKEKVNDLLKGRANPIEVVKEVMNSDIEFYDYRELKPSERKAYFMEARAVLKNKTVQNEIRHIYADLVKHIATKSFSYDEVRDIRMTINGVKILMDKLEEISPGDEEPTKKDIHASI